MRYLAWAAARSAPMQHLELEWAVRYSNILNAQVVEPPPEGMMNTRDRARDVKLIHPRLGERTTGEGDSIATLLDEGWIPDPYDRDNFLEGIHIQAYYFQARWFPRLKWFTLRPPADEFFIIGDRSIGWGVPEDLNAPPYCLRDPSAFLIAPLSRGLALVGRNDTAPWSVTPGQVNRILAAWSHEWIAGPTEDCVGRGLSTRAKRTTH
jgi:hypothetical protein